MKLVLFWHEDCFFYVKGHRRSEIMKSGISPENEFLGVWKSFAYGLQHVLTMYGGIVAPPLIVGTAVHLSSAEIGMLITASLFIGGLATLLQTIGTRYLGAQLPLVQGVSFAGVSTMIAVGASADGGLGFQTILGAVIGSAVIGFLLAPIFAKVLRFFPPVVTGSIITIIGISLLPVALHWVAGNNPSPDTPSMLLAGFTLLVLLVLSKFKIETVRRLAVLFSIVIGTITANLLGLCDFSSALQGDMIAFPSLLHFGSPIFNLPAIFTMCIVTIVILTETTADILAVGEIVGTEITPQRIANGLRADMFSSMIAPLFGTFMQSAFAQNVGLVAMTGIKSRFAVAGGGIILVILGLFPVIGRFVTVIPSAVLGGAGLVLFGSVAASGIRTLSQVKYENQHNLIIVALSLSVGIIPMIMPNFFVNFPKWIQTIFHSGINATCIMAVVLNLFFHHFSLGGNKKESS